MVRVYVYTVRSKNACCDPLFQMQEKPNLYQSFHWLYGTDKFTDNTITLVRRFWAILTPNSEISALFCQRESSEN